MLRVFHVPVVLHSTVRKCTEIQTDALVQSRSQGRWERGWHLRSVQ